MFARIFENEPVDAVESAETESVVDHFFDVVFG